MPRFVDVSVGTKFIHEGSEYLKIKDERINCCKVLNAVSATDKTKKIMIVPITEVEVLENND